MNTSSYPDFFIVSSTEEKALEFAQTHNFVKGSWVRIPSTLEDTVEAFVKETTPILSKEEWKSLSEEEYNDKSLQGSAASRILIAKDLGVAARYASKRNWRLHAWKFISDSDVTDVIEYSYYC